ncbi:MAG: hypothetical protein NTX79_01810 [Candidatus Micrarchaeota archaeon]|nr:hypothetical protein [Candidatus Micrarchaeota archaeon]
MEVKKDRLTKRDQRFLSQISAKLRLSTPVGMGFLAALDKLVNDYPYRSQADLDPTKQQLNQTEIKKVFKKKSSNTHLYKFGYLTAGSKRKLVGLVLKTELRTLYRSGNKGETINDNDFSIFSIDGNRITFTGKEKQFKKYFLDYYHHDIFSVDRPVVQQDPKKLSETFLLAGNKDNALEIYQLHLNQTKDGKKLRIRIFSDSGALMENFNKSLLSEKLLDGVELKNINSIGFKKGNDTVTLKISRVNANQFLLRWKSKNKLSKELSNKFNIGDSDSVIFDQMNEAALISDLFREVKLLPYQKNKIYQSILKDRFYSDLIKIDKNSVPWLNYDSLSKKLQATLRGNGAKINVTRVKKKCGVFFPSRKAKGSSPHKRLLVISKKSKIVQHLLIDHQQIYNMGEQAALKQYFVFVPFLVLDFRKNQREDYTDEKNQELLLSSGAFLSDLKNKPNDVSNLVLNKSKKIIEDKLLDQYFQVACELLDNLASINPLLDSQQKGALFESLCFCILSRILLTKKVGNAYEPDGKFILDDEKIIYDAKNLGKRADNPLLASVSHKGKIKDISYIKNEGVKNYIYIVNETPEAHFKPVKEAIERECNGCKVSAITLSAVRDIVNVYKKDPRKISQTKLKSAILSGTLKSSIAESEITVDV